MIDYERKLLKMGYTATALLQLHLEHPNVWDSHTISKKLFEKFEELELEDEEDGIS